MRSRFRFEIARNQIGRVGFNQQPLKWYVSHGFPQRLPPAFIANPTRDAYVKAELNIPLHLRDRAGKAMRYTANNTRQVFTNNVDESVVSIAFMQEYRLADLYSQFQLQT